MEWWCTYSVAVDFTPSALQFPWDISFLRRRGYMNVGGQ